MAFSDFLSETDGMDKAKVSERLPGLRPGQYKCKVERCVSAKARAGWYYWTAEFEILESSNPESPVGSRANYYIAFNDHLEARKNALLTFLVKGFGLPEADAKKALMGDLITGPKQILTGEVFGVNAKDAVNEKSGAKYTDLQFYATKAA